MSKRESKKNNLVMQGSILAIASLLVRLIGMLYRIPLINILGDEGSGYYGSAYAIYTYLLVVSSYGFPAAVSKLVSARLTKHRYKEAQMVFRTTLIFAIIIGTMSSSMLYFGATWFTNFIVMPESKLALQGLAPALFIFSFMSVFRGYFQGMNTMVPTAYSQLIEQVFNAIFSIVFVVVLLPKGLDYGAAGSSLGTATGALASSIFLVVIYFIMRPVIQKQCSNDINPVESSNIAYYWKLLLMTSIPIVIGTSTFHLTNLVDLVMFNKALDYHGYSGTQIATLYGILEGKYKIIITLPVSVAAAMATASIPSITKSLVLNDHDMIRKKVDLAIRSVLMVSIPAMVGIFVLAGPIIELLFTNSENFEITVNILKIGSLSVVLFGMSTISIGLLQGLDKLKLPVIHSLISLLVKVAFNVILLYVFNFNLYGAVITNIIFAGTSAFLNFRAVKKHLDLSVDLYKTIIAPVTASLIMGGVTIGLYTLFNMKFSGDISTVLVLPFAGVIYLISLLKLKTFNEEELSGIPFGNKLKRFI